MPDTEEKEPEGIVLTFEGDHVKSPWYDPRLAPIICSVCEKGATCKEQHAKPGDGTIRKCLNANPFCG